MHGLLHLSFFLALFLCLFFSFSVSRSFSKVGSYSGFRRHTHRRCEERREAATCVCVCPALDKGFSTTTISTLHEQGGQACHIQPGPTKLGCDGGCTERRLGVYLL